MPTAALTRYQPARVLQLLACLARNIAGDVSVAGLARESGLGLDTVRAYLDALTRVQAWEPLPAWQPPLRTRARLRHRSRAHLADPALACAILHLDGERLANDPDRYAAIFHRHGRSTTCGCIWRHRCVSTSISGCPTSWMRSKRG